MKEPSITDIPAPDRARADPGGMQFVRGVKRFTSGAGAPRYGGLMRRANIGDRRCARRQKQEEAMTTKAPVELIVEPMIMRGMGWLREYPSCRDYTARHDEVAPKLREFGQNKSVRQMLTEVHAERPTSSLPGSADLREWCSPIEDQLTIGSCTAHAGMGMIEYYERRAFGNHIDGSRLFLYKATRNLLNWTGDTGAFLR
jgi:hypothetical protein